MQFAKEFFRLASERYESKEYRSAAEAYKKSRCLKKHWHTHQMPRMDSNNDESKPICS